MGVDKKVRNQINWFIYAYETFDRKEIGNHLLDVSLEDIDEVLNEDFIKATRIEGS